MSIKGFIMLAVITVFLIGVATLAPAQAPQRGTMGEKPGIVEEQLVTTTATVQAIDKANRVVTLKSPDGKVFDVKVGEEVRNLPQVKVGDRVEAKYYQSVAVQVQKPGQAGGVTSTETMTRARPGERPAGAAAREITVTATVQAIAPDKKSVTLKGPEGKTVDVAVRDPGNLENVSVGDQVVIRYTEAVAVSVEKA
ncbi:MAG: hypothetical protein A4E57_03473 [Syntrophorhabdaceae bacterium PtaU1.Bin034]|nr:MAG: hypothetical protein A4E57_03473 [Syntrophorhabdaceae bacterium PtaU1.Bin034]